MNFDEKLEVLKKLKNGRADGVRPLTVGYYRNPFEASIDDPKGLEETYTITKGVKNKLGSFETVPEGSLIEQAVKDMDDNRPGDPYINPLRLPNIGETKILLDGVLFENISNIEWFVTNDGSDYPVVGSITLFVGRPEDNIVPKQFGTITCVTANNILETIENVIVGVKIFGTVGSINLDDLILQKVIYFEAKDIVETFSSGIPTE